jgi:hypothetical protein
VLPKRSLLVYLLKNNRKVEAINLYVINNKSNVKDAQEYLDKIEKDIINSI